MILTYKVDSAHTNFSINQILKSELNISSRLFVKLIKNNLVYLNDNIIDTRKAVKCGDIIKVDLNYSEENENIIPTKMELNIVYEDDSILVLNKQAGIAIHPSMLHFGDTLSNGVRYYFDSINLKKKIRPVNRLDFYTSGLVIFAKNEYIQECLIKQMTNNVFHKEYLAIIEGILENHSGIINKPIGRKKNSIIERCVTLDGKTSVTKYKVLKQFQIHTLIKCFLETGRTHQIRVHFASIGHPLLGDTLYGHQSPLISGQALFCYKLTFIHPITKQTINIELDKNHFEKLYDFL